MYTSARKIEKDRISSEKLNLILKPYNQRHFCLNLRLIVQTNHVQTLPSPAGAACAAACAAAHAASKPPPNTASCMGLTQRGIERNYSYILYKIVKYYNSDRYRKRRLLLKGEGGEEERDTI